MFSYRSSDSKPLNIDWQRMHEEMAEYGYKGGVK
jgi:hypothetical protein